MVRRRVVRYTRVVNQALNRRASGASRALNLWHLISKPLYWLYERRLLRAVQKNGKLPKHLGLILDGNRRYARTLGVDLAEGHTLGAKKAREVIEWCLELGVYHVTLWVFSTENQSRDPQEVAHLLRLFAQEANAMAADQRVHKHGVRVKLIGNIEDFPSDVQDALYHLEEVTKHYDKALVNVAIGYGGREEITHAVRELLRHKDAEDESLASVAQTLSADEIGQHLYTAGTPDPDFVIRTSGEVRLSGFLLWQTAYSEYYFCDVFWPSFRRVDFLRALRDFQARERRFGR